MSINPAVFVKVSIVDATGEAVSTTYLNPDQIAVISSHPLLPGVTTVSLSAGITFNIRGSAEDLLEQGGAEIVDLTA